MSSIRQRPILQPPTYNKNAKLAGKQQSIDSSTTDYRLTTDDCEIYTLFISSLLLYTYSIPLYRCETYTYICLMITSIVLSSKADDNWLAAARRNARSGLMIGICIIPYLLLSMLYVLHSHSTDLSHDTITTLRTVQTYYWIAITCGVTVVLSVSALKNSSDTSVTTSQLVVIPLIIIYSLQYTTKYYITWYTDNHYIYHGLHAEAILLTIIVFTGIQYSLQSLLQFSFTLGESIVCGITLSSSILVWLISLLYNTQIQFIQRRAQHIPHTYNTYALLCISVLPITLLMGGITSSSLMKVLNKSVKMDKIIKTPKLTDTVVMQAYVVIVATISVVVYPLLYITLGNEPITYIVSQVTSNTMRIYIVTYWAICVILGIVVAPRGTTSSDQAMSKTISHTPNILIRKYYHILATLMFTPTIIIDHEFVTLGCCLVTCIFVLIEYIRISYLPPFGTILNSYMKSYIDSRDSGMVILTHCYLLVGIALPVYGHTYVLHSNTSITNILPALSGVLILGVGDSVASFIGTKYGAIKWLQSNKSIQGTISAIISILLSIALIQLGCQQYNIIFTVNWLTCILSTVIVCLLEAFTSQIDNLMLPIIYYSLLLLTQT